MEQIRIRENNGKKAISARELYLSLGYDKSQYSRWYKKNILENSFAIENEDYIGFDIFVEGNKTLDFALSLDFAKKLCMISKTKIGEKIRDYFIECEKKLQSNTYKIPQSYSEALKLAYEQSVKIENQQKQLEEQAPKVAFSNAVMASQNSCLIGELSKILNQNGIKIGQNRLFEWLRENGYLGKSGSFYNIPNQRYIEQGLFEIKKGIRTGKNEELITTTTTKVTGKGQVYFVKKFIDIKDDIKNLLKD